MGSADYSQLTNPMTGRPFGSQQELDSYAAGQKGQATAANRDSGPASAAGSVSGNYGTLGSYNWGSTGTGGDYTKDWNLPSGTYGFQSASGQSSGQGGYGAGYIDPHTGQITLQNYTPGQQAVDNPGVWSPKKTTASYSADFDYGLGPASKGIIPLAHDASGAPTLFYAPVAGGGGKTFTDLAQAQQSVADYTDWYASQHQGQTSPGGMPGQYLPGAGGGTGASAGAAAPTEPGILTKPLQGESYYGETKDFYTQPTNSQKNYDSTKDFYGGTTNAQTVFNETPNQPTQSQQLWNQYSGMYANPNYLDDYYDTEQKKAQSTLDRKAASAGWGDSSASARATGGIGLDFAGRKLLAREGFTTTGMGLAGSADSANNAQTVTRGNLGASADVQNRGDITAGTQAAGQADNANLAAVSGGQVAANSAENLLIGRETGGLNSATTLAQDQAALVSAGLSQAEAQRFSTQLQTLQAQWQSAGLTAQQQYQKAQELAASMGIVSSTALNYYLGTKFGSKTPGTPTSTNLYGGSGDGTVFNV